MLWESGAVVEKVQALGGFTGLVSRAGFVGFRGSRKFWFVLWLQQCFHREAGLSG